MAYNKDMLYFSLPDFYNFYILNLTLLSSMEKNKEYYRDNIVIDSMYGCFPGCIFNGGRLQNGIANRDYILANFKGIYDNNVSVRLTFTNQFITEEQYNDTYARTILECGNNSMNGINVASIEFANWLEKHYPNYYIMYSTKMNNVNTVEDVNKLSEKNLIVLPYTMNNNVDILEKCKHPDNIELLCSEACIDNCPNRKHHYEEIDKAQMGYDSEAFRCPHNCELYVYNTDIITNLRKHHITYEDMIDFYIPRGFNKFKISGRNDNIINVIERYVEYFAKPEYRDIVRSTLLINCVRN